MKKLTIIISILILKSAGLIANNDQQIDSTSIADSLMQVYQFEKAKAIWYDMHRSYPADANVLYKLGLCHVNMGNYSDALIYLNESFKVDSTQIPVLLQLAVVNNKIGQYDKAVDSYNRLIKLDPENGYYHRLTANALIVAKKPLIAVQHLTISIILNEMDMESYNMLAKLYFNMGDFDKASEIASAGLNKNTRNVDLLFINARVFFMTKNYEKVVELGNSALNINADTSRWNLYLGYCNYYLEKYKDCIIFLNTAIDDKSISEQGYTYLANAYIKTDDKVKAKECFDKAIMIAKDDNLESNLQNKAILMHEDRKDSEAISLLEEAYHINKNPQILFRLGQMHFNKKQYSTARSYLNQYQKSQDTLYQKEAISLKEKIKEAEKRP